MWRSVRTAAFAVVAALAGGAAVAQECVMYEHANYNGRRAAVFGGQEFSALGGRWRKKVSSVKTASGCVLELYDRTGFRGDGITVKGAVRHLGRGWNDRAVSARCECPRMRDRRRAASPYDVDASFRIGGVWVGRGRAPETRRRGAACVAFDSAGYNGRWRAFRNGETDMRFGRRLTRNVSAVKVAPGCHAVADIGRRFKIHFDRDVAELPKVLNDKALSMSCRCD